MTQDEPRPDAGAGPALVVPVSSPTSVTLAASFTADGLEEPLSFALQAAGIAADVRSAPYNQVFQELLTPGSSTNRNTGGIRVVLVRFQDLIGVQDQGAGSDQAVARVRTEIVGAIRQSIQRSAAPVILLVLPSSAGLAPGVAGLYAEAESAVAGDLAESAGVVVVQSAIVDRFCTGERFDAQADGLAHIPFTDEYMAALALVVARQIHMLRVPARKVLVLDCDNTLWGGVVGEDGVQGIQIDEHFLAVQRFAIEAQARGILVCLASKNAERDVLDVFEQRADMALKMTHVVAHRINWEPKPVNVASLARQLNLGLNSFVFLDDNPVECGQMREALPDVVTLQLPVPEKIPAFLDNLWTFDKGQVTKEDARRTAMYRENAARDSFEAEAGDIGAFIAALDLRIDIGEPLEDEWPRVAQLTHRTNQFNFTTLRRSEADMRSAAAAGAIVLAVHVRDRFGDYGLVGVVVAQAASDAFVVETFLLSCRVLGRGVEHAIVAHVGRLACEGGLATVRLPYRQTAKNEPARAFADSIFAAHRSGDLGVFEYVVPAAIAAGVVHRPGEDPDEVVEARKSDGKPKTVLPDTSSKIDVSAAYARIAGELDSGTRLLDAMHSASRRQRDLPSPVVPAQTDTERMVVDQWERLLGIYGLGVEDDYFALGGTSLQAARLFADLARQTGVQLPMTSILEAPTPRMLAARIDGGQAVREGGLIPLKVGGKRNIFLVHDGDGETLLYRNLAQLMPDGTSVFGIPPVSTPGIPLMHRRIEDMAAAYVEMVRNRQPTGPFQIGGMCAGGLIAFEMARQLQKAGEQVEPVLLFDTATPQAARRPWRNQRVGRLSQALSEARNQRGLVAAMLPMGSVLAKKAIAVFRYETGLLLRRLTTTARLVFVRRIIERGGAWPRRIPGLDFRTLYLAAESSYRPGPDANGLSTVLLRATSGADDDLAFRDVYEDPTFGWRDVVQRLEVIDVAGGHSSMLQEPHASALARSLEPLLRPRARDVAVSREASHV